jgi:MoaA/NifB/PqqE/SkfB family radical SAM enzyme
MLKETLQKINILSKKIQRLPPDKLYARLKLGIKKEILNSPQYITLQTVSACNLGCKHCFINNYGDEIEDGQIQIMKMTEFKKILARIMPIVKNAEYFTFSSFEALLNKHLFEMMDMILAINPKIKFPFLTNTMILTDEKIKKLEQYPIPEISISLDGKSKEVVESFKTGVDYDKLIDALKRLGKSSFKDRVAVTFVAHKKNIHELPDYVDFVNSLGIKLIYVSNLLSFTKNNATEVLYSPDGNSEAQELFNEAIQRAKKNNQTIQLPELKPILKGCQACETFFIDTNGNVAPCDFLAVTTPFTLFGNTIKNPPQIYGNVLFDDPLEIYRSERYTAFRNAHRLGKELPDVCKNCIDGYGLMCSNRKVYS